MMIGNIDLGGRLLLAPMAGITDLPFRKICRKLGANLAFSEMISSNPDLRDTRKSKNRSNIKDEPYPRAIQILGNDPDEMAKTAVHCINLGADIIDINMGCPAKKVCSKATGSALLNDEPLIKQILDKVITAVAPTPVTLKIRTGWSKQTKNALNVANIAESSGIKALTIHGRTRECLFNGDAEYDTIAAVKAETSIPIIANGDINSAAKAIEVLDKTNADGLMIGRAALGNPWLFSDIAKAIQPHVVPTTINDRPKQYIITSHINEIHNFYGPFMGTKIARKHIQHYCKNQANFDVFWQQLVLISEPGEQLDFLISFLDVENH